MPEFTDDDLSIIQSMMNSNTKDLRNPHAAVPPVIVGGGLGEQTMLEQPSTHLPADQLEALDRNDDDLRRGYLEGDRIESLKGQGRGPRPLDPELVRAMRDVLRPDLSNKNRPNAQELDLRRRHRSAAAS
jgi:hypothetical protein